MRQLDETVLNDLPVMPVSLVYRAAQSPCPTMLRLKTHANFVEVAKKIKSLENDVSLAEFAM